MTSTLDNEIGDPYACHGIWSACTNGALDKTSLVRIGGADIVVSKFVVCHKSVGGAQRHKSLARVSLVRPMGPKTKSAEGIGLVDPARDLL